MYFGRFYCKVIYAFIQTAERTLRFVLPRRGRRERVGRMSDRDASTLLNTAWHHVEDSVWFFIAWLNICNASSPTLRSPNPNAGTKCPLPKASVNIGGLAARGGGYSRAEDPEIRERPRVPDKACGLTAYGVVRELRGSILSGKPGLKTVYNALLALVIREVVLKCGQTAS